ncbi:hypothetical protein CPT_Mokit_256 [Acinetobacter phage Mokit]|nr:hypothetical protein CPT_Mokit_256 [Acinetobacter phage Mokit]
MKSTIVLLAIAISLFDLATNGPVDNKFFIADMIALFSGTLWFLLGGSK